MQKDFKLCKLEGEAVALTRPLYEEVFIEDSKAFVDYYYRKKAPSCIAFAWENESGQIISMLHLDPYQLCVKTNQGEEKRNACYVVCVATKENYRHQGCMAALLKQAEDYCMSKSIPFLFLMPANPMIYEPFGYRFVYHRKEFYVNYYENEFCRDAKKAAPKKVEIYKISFNDGEMICEECIQNIEKLCKPNCTTKEEKRHQDKEHQDKEHQDKEHQDKEHQDKGHSAEDMLCQLKEFTNHWLAENCDYYLYRSYEYYVNLAEELAAQRGCMYVFQMDGQIEGYYAQTKEEESNMGCGKDGIQEAMLSKRLLDAFEKEGLQPPILTSSHTTPVIMAKCVGEEGRRIRPYLFQTEKGWITELI